MNPGRLNKRITLQFPSGSTIVDGVEQPNYINGAEVWAEFDVKPPKGRVIKVAATEHTISTRWVKIRYRTGIESNWRVKYSTKIFNIVSPPLDEGMRHKELYLELQVVE